ncbi:MAG TPA: gamma-glutamyl-gamma-aminobutyrate hydrolase family protein [Bacillota bacterium]|nr:gamma-glutamyl-gamma-aminobutyrate hydrolase family protein [Bacillota bacterium]
MKPLIGISATEEKNGESIGKDSIKAVVQSGGIPIVLTNFALEEDVKAIAAKLDGLLLTGGHDIDPTLYGEEPLPKLGTVTPARDRFELAIAKEMLALDKPIIGVCRGSQILAVATGGTMYQDIYSQIEGDLLQHVQKAPSEHGSHFIEIEEGSLLHALTKQTKLKVNSRHHQAAKDVVAPLHVSAKASDGIIEAVESKEHAFVFGAQWHPENMAVDGDKDSIAIFDGFIAACKK